MLNSQMVDGYVKSPFIVDFPMKNGGSFHSFLYVYHGVNDPRLAFRTSQAEERWSHHQVSSGEAIQSMELSGTSKEPMSINSINII